MLRYRILRVDVVGLYRVREEFLNGFNCIGKLFGIDVFRCVYD